ncbi:hypothetical protein BAMY6639_14080 [Bacillus amyloliquefaciens UMAF6639]|nr:hypothetical protein BAMY6639_14080 [Bacillus amyloliquefaciens UMAF6639]AQP95736.1 hypothetical protein BZ167_06815 [Bacillus sp. 275]
MLLFDKEQYVKNTFWGLFTRINGFQPVFLGRVPKNTKCHRPLVFFNSGRTIMQERQKRRYNGRRRGVSQ